ncbi:MAG: hypothetical protein ABGZ35_00570 [Planctomycetaceae bacterium]|jgi:hypothetical protein
MNDGLWHFRRGHESAYYAVADFTFLSGIELAGITLQVGCLTEAGAGPEQFLRSRVGFWLAGAMDDGLWHFRRGHESAYYAVKERHSR